MSELGYKGTVVIGQTAQYVKDVTVDLSTSEIDDTTRADQGWESAQSGLGKWSINFQMVKKTGDTVYTTLKNAFIAKSIITNVTVTDEQGDQIKGNVCVTKFTRNEPLNGVVTIDVTLSGRGKPTW